MKQPCTFKTKGITRYTEKTNNRSRTPKNTLKPSPNTYVILDAHTPAALCLAHELFLCQVNLVHDRLLRLIR
ncbi:hypothetical protein G7K_0734-t1 [Saitoella complicata NRRL Y-17804]|uniref:Uncharacterized protein n=1 Tax=Saitoella complicata (strain BCRC 22490 / CBS 7301 / JCM 7358 / NBRC 10748 / NRRL Y-17804) TaxID=698492 RepID=A0A0E9N9K5_SAICN|nr:hypothetical protein G7K_0734-t1 [Saitoella complicata NRRL Y-17804]